MPGQKWAGQKWAGQKWGIIFCNIVKDQANYIYRLIIALLKVQLVRGYFEIFGHPGPDNQGHAVIAVS